MSTSEITLPPAVVANDPRRRRTPMVLLAIGVLLVALFIVASVVTVPYDELVPGQAVAVSTLITVPPGAVIASTARCSSPMSGSSRTSASSRCSRRGSTATPLWSGRPI